MPFKHVAHAGRAEGEGKVAAACERNDDVDTLKPRTFHCSDTTSASLVLVLRSYCILMERTARVGPARKTPSVRPSEFVSARVTVAFELELASRQTPVDTVYDNKILMHAKPK
jgi:hypothetical protein